MPKIFIDGKEILAAEGDTILSASLAAGVYIPNLCSHPSLKSSGECKLCTVELDGELVTACTTEARDGM